MEQDAEKADEADVADGHGDVHLPVELLQDLLLESYDLGPGDGGLLLDEGLEVVVFWEVFVWFVEFCS